MAKLKSWGDEEIGATRGSARRRDRLQRARCGGADGHDTPRRLDSSQRLCRHVVRLGVNHMVARIVDGDGRERVKPDHEFHRRRRDSHRADLSQQLRREVQPGGGRSGRLGIARVDGLITALVAESLRDVGRQRYLAEPVDESLRVRMHELDAKRVALLAAAVHHDDWSTIVAVQCLAGLHLAAGSQQCLPHLVGFIERFEQQHFHRSAAGTREVQPRRHHFGVVHDEHVTIAQELRQVTHGRIARRRRALVDEQSRRVARLDRNLRDQFFRKFVVDVRKLHAAATLRHSKKSPREVRTIRVNVLAQPARGAGTRQASRRGRAACARADLRG